MKKVTVVIPARHEEGELGNRNILPFADSNLLAYKLDVLKQVKDIDRIIVSSDDGEILRIAEERGAEALLRPTELLGDDVPFSDFVKHICKVVAENDVMFTFATSPLIKKETYENALNLYWEKIEEHYDSLVSVLPYKGFLMDDNGALNFRTGRFLKKSSLLPQLYMFTNSITIAPREKMLQWGYYWGHMPYRMEINKIEAISIYDQIDYQMAQQLIELG